MNAKFKGRLWLEDVVEPESYTLNFSGEGVAAGFANGAAKVKLVEEGGATILDYAVKASIGGKLAQIGQPPRGFGGAQDGRQLHRVREFHLPADRRDL